MEKIKETEDKVLAALIISEQLLPNHGAFKLKQVSFRIFIKFLLWFESVNQISLATTIVHERQVTRWTRGVHVHAYKL